MTCFSLLNLSLVMLSVSHCLAAAAAANNIIQLVVTNVATGQEFAAAAAAFWQADPPHDAQVLTAPVISMKRANHTPLQGSSASTATFTSHWARPKALGLSPGFG